MKLLFHTSLISKNLLWFFLGFWIVFVMFLYFFSIDIRAACSSQSFCLPWLSENFLQVSWRSSHAYFIAAFLGIFKTYVFGGENTLHPFWSLIFIAALFYGLLKIFAVKQKHASYVQWPVWIFAVSGFVFYLCVHFIWSSFYGLPQISWFHIQNIKVLGSFLSLCIIFTALGRTFRKKFFSQFLILQHIIFDMGFGTLLFSLVLMLLTFISQLTFFPVVSFLFVSLILSRKALYEIFHSLLFEKINFSLSFKDSNFWGIFIFLLVVSHTILELFRPIPLGFDDLGLYMNVPKLLSETGSLITGLDSYMWGYIMSLGFIVFHSPTVALFLSFLGGVLCFFGFIHLLEVYREKIDTANNRTSQHSIFIASLFYALPTVVFQSAKDMKVDLAALFFLILACILFLHIQTLSHGKEKIKLLCVFSLFLGMSFGIKYTTILGTLAFFILFGVQWILQHTKDIKRTFVHLLLYIVLFSLPVAPYFIRNALETSSFSVSHITKGKSQAPLISVPLQDIQSSQAAFSTGKNEELGRYFGYSSMWKNILLLPFTITFNPLVFGMYVDIGYIFLLLGSCACIFLFIKRKEISSLSYQIWFLTALYLLLWAFTSQGVIWYGYFGLILLLLIGSDVFKIIKHHAPFWFRSLCLFSIFFWIMCALFLRIAFLPSYGINIDSLGLAYANSVITQQTYLEKKIPTYMKIVSFLKENEVHSSAFVYRVGTFIKYFISENHRFVIDDNQLNIIGMMEKLSDSEIIERFRSSGVRYIILDTNTPFLDKTEKQSLLKKYSRFLGMIRNFPQDIHIIFDEEQNGIIFAEILPIEK